MTVAQKASLVEACKRLRKDIDDILELSKRSEIENSVLREPCATIRHDLQNLEALVKETP